MNPLTKQELARMKNDKMALLRKSDIEMIVGPIYNGVMNASMKGETSYRDNRIYPILRLSLSDNKFKPDLMTRLQSLFPDSQIEYQQTDAVDGSIIEIVILIDWS